MHKNYTYRKNVYYTQFFVFTKTTLILQGILKKRLLSLKCDARLILILAYTLPI